MFAAQNFHRKQQNREKDHKQRRKERHKANKLTKTRNIFTIDVGRKYNIPKQLFGLLVFVIIFVGIIPTMIYKWGDKEFLAAYLPNLDLIANIMSYHGGPTVGDYVSELYPPTPTTTYGFLSASFINWLALMGLTFLVAQETLTSGDIYTGWSLGFAMIFITYLLPGQLISGVMDNIYEYLEEKSGIKIFENVHGHATWNVVVIVGFLVAFMIIKFEEYIIHLLRKAGLLRQLAKFILTFPKRFSKKNVKRTR